MKDKITRLRFKKKEFNGNDNFWIEINPDQDNSELDIAIHEIVKPISIKSADPGKSKIKASPKTLQDPKEFYLQINNAARRAVTQDELGDIIIKPNNPEETDYEVIYQFSISFDQFKTDDNIVIIYDHDSAATSPDTKIASLEFFAETQDKVKDVRLNRPGTEPTDDIDLWDKINSRIKDPKMKFSDYKTFIDRIICNDPGHPPVPGYPESQHNKKRSPFIKSDEYNLIKFATDFYMTKKLGLDTSNLSSKYYVNGRLPYYDIVIQTIEDDINFQESLNGDCQVNQDDRINNLILIELIWNYWMEQGMLVQTMNVINLRFQNIKGNFYADRLQRFDADPLRPLSHILWGYIQDEQHRLSLPRRLNEYDHEYGLTLTGRAVPRITPVDTRVKFLEAFHSLLTQCTIYFKESDDTTRIADAFPILNSLKEVHLLLAEGNHNAYGNLTWTARQEMMMQQYILSRGEMREFLGGKVMVPYPEPWMDKVDTMRNLQGWGGTGIVHYHELANHGEMILLSIRYGNWSDINLDSKNAANWAQNFRNSVQRYIHAYRSVTGIDMSVDQVVQLPGNFAAQPAYLIQQRLLEERARTRRA